MPKVTFITRDKQRLTVEADEGDSVMMAAVENGVDGIVAECGGNCSCATCHCYVAPEWIDRVGPPDIFEERLLDSAKSARRPGSRLSCQIELSDELDGLVVEIPEEN